ncbi:hypothetical protein Ahy_B08g091030 [Arachis hypogaea]|uniref:PB1-like domain-containing protein n=1 Tax=Arachis hypogaea TaxID=3818 RepID=A0A444Y180_ARAHY|nr:hypothetical protein Ahy_B08g091030 [Arachis hypogaea]
MKRLRFEGIVKRFSLCLWSLTSVVLLHTKLESLFLYPLSKQQEDEEDCPIERNRWSRRGALLVRLLWSLVGNLKARTERCFCVRSKRVWRPCTSKMEGPPITFIFHHGGSFKNDEKGSRIYEPDNTEVLVGVDGDTLDVFFVKGYYK